MPRKNTKAEAATINVTVDDNGRTVDVNPEDLTLEERRDLRGLAGHEDWWRGAVATRQISREPSAYGRETARRLEDEASCVFHVKSLQDRYYTTVNGELVEIPAEDRDPEFTIDFAWHIIGALREMDTEFVGPGRYSEKYPSKRPFLVIAPNAATKARAMDLFRRYWIAGNVAPVHEWQSAFEGDVL